MSDDEQLASDAVKDCAESVARDNPDLTKSQSFAICQAMENRGELQAAGVDLESDECGEGEILIDGECRSVDMESVDAPPSVLNQSEAVAVRLLETDIPDADPVQRTEHDDGSVTYRNLLFLAPGEWTDAASGETIEYTADAIRTLVENRDEKVQDTTVNINHEHRDQLKTVGNFDPESLHEVDGHLFGDVTLHGRTSVSEDAIALMDLALESDGEEGAGGLSVEIPVENEVTEFDTTENIQRMLEFDLAGLAIVTDAASTPAAFSEQLDGRAVALSDALDGEVRVYESEGVGETPNPEQAESLDMDTDELQQLIRDTVREELEATTTEEEDDEEEEEETAELQEGEPAAMVQDLVEQAEGEGFDPSESTLAELIEFVQGNLDVGEDVMGEMQDLVGAFMETVEADDPGAASAEAFQDWLAEAMNPDDDDEEGGEGEVEEEAPESQEMSELREELRELRETVEELESGEPKTLAADAIAEEVEDDTGGPVVGGHSRSHTGHIGR